MNRRFFLQQMVAPHVRTNVQDKLDAVNELPPIIHYYSESGLAGIDSQVIAGLISMNRDIAVQFENDIMMLRESHNYWPRLSHKSNDKYKIPFASELIESFVTEQTSLVLHVVISSFSGESLTNEFQVPTRLSNRDSNLNILLEANTNLSTTSTEYSQDSPGVLMKVESPFGPSTSYVDTFFTNSNISFHAVDTRNSQILQFLDLITGAIACDIRGGSKSATKNAVLQAFRSSLGVNSLTPESLIGSTKVVFL